MGLLLLLFCFLSNVNNSLKSSNFREKKRANEDMLVCICYVCVSAAYHRQVKSTSVYACIGVQNNKNEQIFELFT